MTQNRKILETYIKLDAEIEKLEAMKSEMRELILNTYPQGYSDETINIHFKEISKWEYPQELLDLEKQQKLTIKHLKEVAEEQGTAKKSTIKQLTITIK